MDELLVASWHRAMLPSSQNVTLMVVHTNVVAGANYAK